MTPQEIRIAVAEECGWKLGLVNQGLALWQGPKGEMFGHGQLPPDYCNDLNAIHKAEATLKEPSQKDSYCLCLANVTSGRVWNDFKSMDVIAWITLRPTALQRCEAFLRTVGKWKE